MIYIKKTSEPNAITNWKKKYYDNNGVEAVYNNLMGKEKQDYKKTLMEEQFYLCAYCCNNIEAHSSHFEHIKPQSRYLNDTLDYKNIVISCNGVKLSEDNCGHHKDDWYKGYYFISPLIDECNEFFGYLANGKMIAKSGDTRAKETIEKLNLDSDLLRRARNSAIYTSGYFELEYDEELEEVIGLEQFIEDVISVNDVGEKIPFCNAIQYVAENN